jgi:NAD(P)-dependent dehydrogenase (short-subunit alcohol dehydrogenase family)
MSNRTLPGQEFDGLVAVVTGGAGGIGSATARYLAARGAKIAVVDREFASTTGYLEVTCDITKDADVKAGVAKVVAELGGIDILINNAGIGAAGDVTANNDEEWIHVLNVNLLGAVRMTRAALPHLRASKSPAVVNTCSIVAGLGLPNRALYSATKGGLESLTRAMAADYLTEGIRVNAVSPATADTPWVARLLAAADDPAAMSANLIARQPMKRLISADEIAHAIAYLAHPLSSSTTGTVLPVDAGMHSLRVN